MSRVKQKWFWLKREKKSTSNFFFSVRQHTFLWLFNVMFLSWFCVQRKISVILSFVKREKMANFLFSVALSLSRFLLSHFFCLFDKCQLFISKRNEQILNHSVEIEWEKEHFNNGVEELIIQRVLDPFRLYEEFTFVKLVFFFFFWHYRQYFEVDILSSPV